MHKLVFDLTIVNKADVTVTLGWHDSKGCFCIIALKASGRDYTNNNELLHKIGVLQRFAMQLFVFTR